MRILWLTHEHPQFPGPAHRAWTQLALSELSKRHQITFVNLRDLPDAARCFLLSQHIQVLTEASAPASKSLFARLQRKCLRVGRRLVLPDVFYRWSAESASVRGAQLSQIQARDFDLAVVDHLGFANLLSFLPKAIKRCVIVANIGEFLYTPTRNHNLLEQLWLSYRRYRLRRADLRALEHIDLAVCMNQTEKTWIDSQAKVKTCLAPVATDPSYFRESVPAQAHLPQIPWLVFTASFEHPPNVDAALFLCNDILPLVRVKIPNAGVLLVGLNPPAAVTTLAEKDNSIVVTGAVSDVRSYMAAASVYVAPVRYGAGVKVKVMESLSAGMATVATSVACSGLGVRNRQELIIADEPQEFASAVISLLEDKNLRTELGSCGASFAMDNFDYKKRVQELEHAWSELIGDENIANTCRSKR